jgi:hypothetical protein
MQAEPTKAKRAELDQMISVWGGDLGWIYEGDIYVAQRLMFHYALLINPTEFGHEQRYCYKDLRLIELAAKEQRSTGKLRYWHKDHTKNQSVIGNYLFPAGAFHEDTDQALSKVNWSTSNAGTAHITCPKCDRSSFSTDDIKHVFCIACGYHSDILIKGETP